MKKILKTRLHNLNQTKMTDKKQNILNGSGNFPTSDHHSNGAGI